MFGLFSGKNSSLGIDIGTTNVKIVELRKENNIPVLLNYAISYNQDLVLQSSNLEILDGQTTKILQEVLRKGKFKAKRAVVGIPTFFSLVSFIEIPEMPTSEVEKAVRFEAAKLIPSPIDEVSFGWEIIGSYQEKSIEGSQSTRGVRKMEVMVVTVPNSVVKKLSSEVSSLRLNVAAMEVENFAVARSLVGNDKGTFLIIDIGGSATSFTITSGGVVRVTRSIDIGGMKISRALAGSLGVDLQRAEQIKKSNQINLLNPRDHFSSLVTPIVGMLAEEAKGLREAFYRRNPLKKIDKVILTGGTSRLATLEEYFSQQLSLECRKGDPLARIGVKREHREVAEEVAPELAMAIGLALRGLEGLTK